MMRKTKAIIFKDVINFWYNRHPRTMLLFLSTFIIDKRRLIDRKLVFSSFVGSLSDNVIFNVTR